MFGTKLENPWEEISAEVFAVRELAIRALEAVAIAAAKSGEADPIQRILDYQRAHGLGADPITPGEERMFVRSEEIITHDLQNLQRVVAGALRAGR